MANARDALVSSLAPLFRPRVSEPYASFAQWESGYDESVEVNQRALIDKVLARYSGEFTGEYPCTSREYFAVPTAISVP